LQLPFDLKQILLESMNSFTIAVGTNPKIYSKTVSALKKLALV